MKRARRIEDRSRQARAPAEKAPDDLGDDRLDRRARARRPSRPRSATRWPSWRRRAPKSSGMTADLSKYTDLHIFAKEFSRPLLPDGHGRAAADDARRPGMAREGFVPFATTYAVFASRRAYDFICLAIAEENLNVKIACALPGLTTGYGPSHQATEDIAIFRGMPNMTIIDPCDALEIEQVVPAIAAHRRPGLYAAAARQRAAGARRVRLHVRARARRSSSATARDVLVISSGLHDHAGAGSGQGA